MLNDSQLKQIMFEAKNYFDESEYDTFKEGYYQGYIEEVNRWNLFTEYMDDMEWWQIIDMFFTDFYEEATEEDVKKLKTLISDECSKVFKENIKTIFPMPSIARIFVGE